jgi:hypothetical protein
MPVSHPAHNSSTEESYHTQHAPFGAFASFTVGLVDACGGFGQSLRGPANQNVYVGFHPAGQPAWRLLPFFNPPQSGESAYTGEEGTRQYDPYPNGLPEAVQRDQAKRYADLFSLFRKHRDKFSRVTFWGVHDGQSWRTYLPITGRSDYPMLFDRRCQPKPALNAVVRTAQDLVNN